MIFSRLRYWLNNFHSRKISLRFCSITLLVGLISFLVLGTPSATAGLEDDRFDGNIFALYAGNGSLVPPRMTLMESFQRDKVALLVFYVEDSSDCKRFSEVISQLQRFYGKVASFIPINVDSIPIKDEYNPEEVGYYYQGAIPQTVLLNQNREIVFNQTGQAKFEDIDSVFREVFDLLPRSESIQLKRRSFNEFNSELIDQ